ncbi:MAG: YceH family protein [Pseudomonadota bacterium]
MSELQLSPAEARVVAALVEKSIATPQYYPMTVNAIMLAANQKTSRSPVMSLTEGEVGAALNRLEELKLVVRDSFSGRVQKWRHQFQHQMLLKPPTLAVLVTLMLRGPQTAAELRANAEPLGGPKDVDALEAALNDLLDRAQPLVVQLARAPGRSAVRWAHMLSGVPSAEALSAAEPERSRGTAGTGLAELHARIEALEARVTELETQLGLGHGPDTGA